MELVHVGYFVNSDREIMAFLENEVACVSKQVRAVLALEDGAYFEGRSVGAEGRVFGEVVFNTSMTGYQEVLTDPSYRGEIVAMTYPLIGNYGVNDEDIESARPHARGFVVRELAGNPSNWRSKFRLADFLKQHGVVGIEGVDTRALTRRIREQGAMRGVIASGDVDPNELVHAARSAPDLSSQDLVSEVSVKEPYVYADLAGPSVTVVDFGTKLNILRSLKNRGCRVTVVPAKSTAAQVMATRPDGVILSNGPGDPIGVPYAVDTVKDLLGHVSIFGICFGHQILGLALGGSRFKMKYGHRGGNHPVKELATGRVYITSQNHGFAIEDGSFSDPNVVVTHKNVNDQTVEGLAHRSVPAFSVQYHPEASPGPNDSGYLFDRFIEGLTRPA